MPITQWVIEINGSQFDRYLVGPFATHKQAMEHVVSADYFTAYGPPNVAIRPIQAPGTGNPNVVIRKTFHTHDGKPKSYVMPASDSFNLPSSNEVERH